MTLQNAAGTILTTGSFPATQVSNPPADPLMKVTVDVFELKPFDTEDPLKTSGTDRILKFHKDQLARQSEITAAFVVATVSAISPATGTTAGGTTVTLTGTHLDGVTGVTFGGTAATSVVVVNPSTVTCVTPAKTASTVNVVITDDAGSLTKTAAFVFA